MMIIFAFFFLRNLIVFADSLNLSESITLLFSISEFLICKVDIWETFGKIQILLYFTMLHKMKFLKQNVAFWLENSVS